MRYTVNWDYADRRGFKQSNCRRDEVVITVEELLTNPAIKAIHIKEEN